MVVVVVAVVLSLSSGYGKDQGKKMLERIN